MPWHKYNVSGVFKKRSIVMIGGIQMPDRIHEGVVRHRMKMWGIIPTE